MQTNHIYIFIRLLSHLTIVYCSTRLLFSFVYDALTGTKNIQLFCQHYYTTPNNLFIQ